MCLTIRHTSSRAGMVHQGSADVKMGFLGRLRNGVEYITISMLPAPSRSADRSTWIDRPFWEQNHVYS